MGSRYEVEVTVGSARDLKNVNWRHGDLRPYAVAWVDSGTRCSTRVDLDGGENPAWDEKVLVPLPPASRLDDAVLHVDVVHANADEGVKPLVGSARLPLRDVLDEAGLGGKAARNLRLKRPSGRPQGRLDVHVAVKEPARYYDPYPAPGGYAQTGTRDPYGPGPGGYYGGGSGGGGGYGGGYGSGAAYGSAGFGAAQPYAAAPPAGYPSAYGSAAPPPQPAYGAPPAASAAYGAAAPAAYGAAAPAYGAAPAAVAADGKKKDGKMGMGTGLAVGAAAGVLGGLALAGGASFLENKMEERVAERVEDNLEREDSYGGGGGYGGGYDDYGGDEDY
ncbi:protein SRC2 homolog [Panicum virgatum]|uniref:C2 domain-containing protein n=1 Tax=Panicum virgatum TaxID=38727 RepID=A0A8T0VEM4_PANVG|nr:protein SRC2 homolog [Panicum virgatum]KAG2633660.1 hypothetical protein PVAP13_2NG241700 [Panicum virgatum]